MTKAHADSGRRPSQARRSRPAEPEIPQPSFSERARTLLDRQATGYLSTHSRRHLDSMSHRLDWLIAQYLLAEDFAAADWLTALRD